MSTEDAFTGEFFYSPTNFKIPKATPQQEAPQRPQEENDAAPMDFIPLLLQENAPAAAKSKRKRKAAKPQKMDIDEVPIVLEEEPTTYGKRSRMGNALLEMLEEDLPVELKSLMKPLCCDLCSVKLNSVLTANMHYESKNHDKKINNWLLEWAKKTGQSPPKRQKTPKDGPVGPNAFHCAACDIPLTSLQHARTHYSGRKHQLVIAGRANPSGSGYYSPEGKWVRQLTKTSPDPSGRFGIGESFVKPPPPAATVTLQAPNQIFCTLCSVSVTSDTQMKLHLEGSKHSKRLKASTEATHPPPSSSNDTVMESVLKPQLSPKRDISIHRTPSGNYYCNVCDVTVNNDNLFNQHLDSKKHMKKLKAAQ